MKYGEVRGTMSDLEALSAHGPGWLPEAAPADNLPRRINLEPEKVERGLTQLVLALVELVRRLLERQALRRIEGGSLAEAQVERLGTTLMRLEKQMDELKAHFEIEDLNIDLGPLGHLLDESDRGGGPGWNRGDRG